MNEQERDAFRAWYRQDLGIPVPPDRYLSIAWLSWKARSAIASAQSEQDSGDAERLLFVSQHGLDAVSYCTHVLKVGGNGDLGDIRSYIDAAIALQEKM